MNNRLFGLTSGERVFLTQPHLPLNAYHRLVRYASTLAPSTNTSTIKFFTTRPTYLCSKPPRYFARGALEKSLTPLPQLLSESDATPLPRPIPRNRGILTELCRGKGTLRQDKQGHLYLEIDNRFIIALLPFLKSQGVVRPPYFNLFGPPGGAHISVITSREAAFHDLKSLGVDGKEMFFEIDGLYSIKPTTWPEVEQVWFFKVRSPELEKFRKKYFLPSLPCGHSFLIAVAVKPMAKPSTKLPMLRISPCVTAA